jgi:hypothetical protein
MGRIASTARAMATAACDGGLLLAPATGRVPLSGVKPEARMP